MKQLDIKDAADKTLAIEAATKAAKKLKTKSPKKKKEYSYSPSIDPLQLSIPSKCVYIFRFLSKNIQPN
jgi:hypothetical protein